MTVGTGLAGHDGRPLCAAETRSGGSCTQPAGWGTDHVGVGCCKLHAGSTPNHTKAARTLQARQLLGTLGVVEDPSMLPPVHVAAELQLSLATHVAKVRWLEWQVGALRTDEVPVSPWPKMLAEARKDADRLLVECGRLSIDQAALQLEEDQGRLFVRLVEGALLLLSEIALARLVEALPAHEQEAMRQRLRGVLLLDPLDERVRAVVSAQLRAAGSSGEAA